MLLLHTDSKILSVLTTLIHLQNIPEAVKAAGQTRTLTPRVSHPDTLQKHNLLLVRQNTSDPCPHSQVSSKTPNKS